MKCRNLNHRAGPDPMPTPPPTPQNAKSQFCTECKAESGLAITAHHTPQACRTPEGPESTESLVVVPVGGDGAWPGFKTTRRATHQRPSHWCGGHRSAPEDQAAAPVGGGGAWPASRRRATTHAPQAPPVWRAPEGPEGTAGLRGAAPEGAGGPGCGARGRWRGLAGLRDRPLRAAGSRVAISRAGRRPRAHQAARPVIAYKNAHPEPGGRF